MYNLGRFLGWLLSILNGPNGSATEERMSRMAEEDYAHSRDRMDGVVVPPVAGEYGREAVDALQRDMDQIRDRLSPYGIEMRARERADASADRQSV